MTVENRVKGAAAGCGMIATWKAQEAPRIRNSVLSALAALSRGSGLLRMLAATDAFTASDAMSSPPFAHPAVPMARLPE